MGKNKKKENKGEKYGFFKSSLNKIFFKIKKKEILLI